MKLLAATAAGIVLAFSAPAMAATSAACQASWSKMDSGKAGYVSSETAREEMAKMKSANLRTAREDQMTAQEYMSACEKGVFEGAR